MIRRPYLPYIIRACAPDTSTLGDLGAHAPWSPAPTREFWTKCGHDMGKSCFPHTAFSLEFIMLITSSHSSNGSDAKSGYDL
jgi:hypothetical protein